MVLSTIHSAKGQEWDIVYLLNVVDGNFPSEFSTGKPELIEEERRLLYVAMTRARNELHLCAPLNYAVTQQAKDGDAHVYGAKSRFMTTKVLDCFERTTFRSLRGVESLGEAEATTVDVVAQDSKRCGERAHPRTGLFRSRSKVAPQPRRADQPEAGRSASTGVSQLLTRQSPSNSSTIAKPGARAALHSSTWRPVRRRTRFSRRTASRWAAVRCG